MDRPIVLCRCGRVIADRLDPDALARTLEATAGPRCRAIAGIAFACHGEGLAAVVDAARSGGGRVGVLACSEAMHGATFRGALGRAGLDPSGLTLVDVRREGWRHELPSVALEEALRRARGALGLGMWPRPAGLRPRSVIVVGAGPVGLRTAASLADGGVRVVLVERDERPGGRAAGTGEGRWVAAELAARPEVEVRCQSRLTAVGVLDDALDVDLVTGAQATRIRVGAIVLAVGCERRFPPRGVEVPEPLPAAVIDEESLEARLDGRVPWAVTDDEEEASDEDSTDPGLRPEHAASAASPTEHAAPAGSLEEHPALAASDAEPPAGPTPTARPHAVVLAGAVGAPVEEILASAIRLASRLPVTEVVFVHPGLAPRHLRLAREARRRVRLVCVRGVVTRVAPSHPDLTVFGTDLDLGRGITVSCDAIVLQAARAPDPELAGLARVLGLTLAPDGYLDGDPPLEPPMTRSHGVFVASGRGPQEPSVAMLSAQAAAAACLAFLGVPRVER